jgi:hypothetical protein
MIDDGLRALYALHDLQAPSPGAAAARSAHRPIRGFTRTLDAACLYRELGRRGLNGREAAEAVRVMLGTSRSSVLKYQRHPIEPASEESDHRMAGFVVAKYWATMIRHKWPRLDVKVRDALMPNGTCRLLLECPPPAPKT